MSRTRTAGRSAAAAAAWCCGAAQSTTAGPCSAAPRSRPAPPVTAPAFGSRPSSRHRRGGAGGREYPAVAALQRGIACRAAALALVDQLGRRALEDDLPVVHQRDLAARGADVLDQMRADDHG